MTTHDDTNTPAADGLGGEPSDLGADANPFEQGTGDPTGAGTVETPNVDGGRPDGAPGEDATASDSQPHDPVDAAAESKQTVTNDAVAGETVEGEAEGEAGPGLIEPLGGISDDEENRSDFSAVDGEADTVADQAEADPDGGIHRR